MEGLTFFDANCMLGKWGTYEERFPLGRDALIRVMDKHRIEEALVYSALSREYDPMVGNRVLLDEISDESRFQPCWAALPPYSRDMPPLSEFVGQMKEKGVRAVRVFPDPTVHRFSLAEWSCDKLFNALEEAQVPLFLDFTGLNFQGEDFPPDVVYDLCKAHPKLPVILLHPGYRTGRAILPLLDKLENLRIETSRFMLHRGIEYISKNFGAHRLIFGTKLPHQAPGALVSMVAYANIGDEEKRMIAGENLRALLKGVKW